MGEIITSVDMRSILPPVRDQGRRGTCLAFAVTSGHEAVRAKGQAVLQGLCEEVLYWGARQFCSHLGSGITFAAATSALDSPGQPASRFWPYDDQRDEDDASYSPPSEAILPNNCYRATLDLLPVQVEHCKNLLRNWQPVVLAVRVSEPLFTTQDGRVVMPTPSQVINDTHAVLLVGFADDGDLAGHFILRNSWSSDWGDGGYGYIPYAYVEQFGIRAGKIETP